MEINGHTRLCGLIGNPVEHTLSPTIHNYLAGQLGQQLVYVPFCVEKGNLEAAVKGAFALNVLGMNVTVPYKSEVIPFLDGIDHMAAQIGAVNTLVRTEKGYRGYNTDILGLYRAMEEAHISLKGEAVVLLGAGGAARAAAFLCGEKQAERLYILNRSFDKARALSREVNKAFGREYAFPIRTHRELPYGKFLAIQSTSAGLYPDVEKAPVEEEAFYRKLHTGYDLIYRPGETEFMKRVRAAGGRAYNGLSMLLYQGVTAYELFTKTKVSEKDCGEIYRILKERVLGGQ